MDDGKRRGIFLCVCVCVCVCVKRRTVGGEAASPFVDAVVGPDCCVCVCVCVCVYVYCYENITLNIPPPVYLAVWSITPMLHRW
jgi:hypothetical protein